MFLNPWVDKSVLTSSNYKHQNITGTLVFTIVFGIQFNFFIVLSVWLEIYRSNVVFFYLCAWKTCASENQAYLGCFAHLNIVPDWHRAINLSRPVLRKSTFFIARWRSVFPSYFSKQFVFDLKSIYQEFVLFLKSLNKHSIPYFIIELSHEI